MSDQTDEALARELLEGLPWHRPSPVLLRWKTRWIADALPDVIALLQRVRSDERQKRQQAEASLAQLQGKYNVDVEFWKAHANAKDEALAQARRVRDGHERWAELYKARIDASLALILNTRAEGSAYMEQQLAAIVKVLRGEKEGE